LCLLRAQKETVRNAQQVMLEELTLIYVVVTQQVVIFMMALIVQRFVSREWDIVAHILGVILGVVEKYIEADGTLNSICVIIEIQIVEVILPEQNSCILIHGLITLKGV